MNDQSLSSSRKEIIETIVFDPINSEWNQQAVDEVVSIVPNRRVRLVSFDGPEELSNKLQTVMMSSFGKDNRDNSFLTGTEIKLSTHHQSVSSLSFLQARPQDCTPNCRYKGQSHDGSIVDDEVDGSGFDESNFTSSPTHYQIPVIPEPPMEQTPCEQERFKTNQQCKAKPVRQKGIKLDDVLRTRLWGKCLRLSSACKPRRPTLPRHQASTE